MTIAPDQLHEVSPVRVAVGEDDVLLREGIVRILTVAGLKLWRRPAMPTTY